MEADWVSSLLLRAGSSGGTAAVVPTLRFEMRPVEAGVGTTSKAGGDLSCKHPFEGTAGKLSVRTVGPSEAVDDVTSGKSAVEAVVPSERAVEPSEGIAEPSEGPVGPSELAAESSSSDEVAGSFEEVAGERFEGAAVQPSVEAAGLSDKVVAGPFEGPAEPSEGSAVQSSGIGAAGLSEMGAAGSSPGAAAEPSGKGAAGKSKIPLYLMWMKLVSQSKLLERNVPCLNSSCGQFP